MKFVLKYIFFSVLWKMFTVIIGKHLISDGHGTLNVKKKNCIEMTFSQTLFFKIITFALKRSGK